MRSALLATALATAYALLRGWPTGMHPLLRACLAVLALVLGIAVWRSRAKINGSKAQPVRPAHWPDYLAMGLGVLSVECLFLFFFAVAPPKAEAVALIVEEIIRPEAAAAREKAMEESAARRHGNNVSGNWLWDSMGRRRLPDSTNARPSNRPEVFFRSTNPTTTKALQKWRPYISAFALEDYEDSIWGPEPIPPRVLTPDQSGSVPFLQAAQRPGPLLTGEIFHSVNSSGQDVLTTVQNPVSVRLTGLRLVSPGIVRLAPLAHPDKGYNYKSSSRPLRFEQLIELQLHESIQPGLNQVPSLLALPKNTILRDRLLEIANFTQGPLEQRLTAVRKFLREHCKYSLQITNEGGHDPIENFLFHERRGHCEFFATAGALLCRALEVPSRVAYGWTGGRFFPGQDLFMFRSREAHAWTEIYLENYGWVIFDCTPPDSLGAASSSVAEEDEKAPLNDEGQIIEEEDVVVLAIPIGNWPWIAFGASLGLIPLLACLLRFRKRPRPTLVAESAFLLPEPPNYLTRFKKACQRLGHPMPPGRTLRQHLQSLTQEDLAPDFADELLAYHYTTTYGDNSPDRAKEKQLSKVIASW